MRKTGFAAARMKHDLQLELEHPAEDTVSMYSPLLSKHPAGSVILSQAREH
jgi:hypothetical protein